MAISFNNTYIIISIKSIFLTVVSTCYNITTILISNNKKAIELFSKDRDWIKETNYNFVCFKPQDLAQYTEILMALYFVCYLLLLFIAARVRCPYIFQGTNSITITVTIIIIGWIYYNYSNFYELYIIWSI